MPKNGDFDYVYDDSSAVPLEDPEPEPEVEADPEPEPELVETQVREYTLPGGTKVVFSDKVGVITSAFALDLEPGFGYLMLAEIPNDMGPHSPGATAMKRAKLEVLAEAIQEMLNDE
jgi:hypothetical protein